MALRRDHYVGHLKRVARCDAWHVLDNLRSHGGEVCSNHLRDPRAWPLLTDVPTVVCTLPFARLTADVELVHLMLTGGEPA